MKADAVARRYARAIFELAEHEHLLESVAAALAAIAPLLEDERMARALTGPVPREEKHALLRRISEDVGAPPAFRDMLLLLADRARLAHLPAIRAVFDALVDRRLGRTRALVRSATELAPDLLQDLARAFGAATGKEVLTAVEVEPELLAGLIVEIEGRVYDGSLRTQLAKLRQQMASVGE